MHTSSRASIRTSLLDNVLTAVKYIIAIGYFSYLQSVDIDRVCGSFLLKFFLRPMYE